MEDIKLIYSDYEEIVLINHFLSKITKKNNDIGSFIILDNKLKIKWDNKEESFIKNEKNSDEIISYNIIIDKIYIIHETWQDTCILNKDDNFLYREYNKEDNGTYELDYNKLIIYWLKWDAEIFILNTEDNIFYYNSKKNINNEIMIYHINWNDICIINYKDIYRKSNNEFGEYKIENNILIIFWEKWESESFYDLNNNYYHKTLLKFLNYENNEYIINFYNNKIYQLIDFYKECGSINIIDNTIEIEHLNQLFYYKYDENKIIIFKDYLKNIILVKKFEQNITINLLNDEFMIDELKGTYNIKDDIIHIYWHDLEINEIYILNNNKYYYDQYIEISKKELFLLNDNLLKYNINFFYNYLYNEFEKISFIENNNIFYIIRNDILEKYHLINNYLILDEIYNKFFKQNNFNINIYKKYNKNLNYLSDDEVYFNWIKNILSDNIYSIESFLNKNSFFNIKGYRDNNYFNNNEESVLHFLNNRLTEYFYSNNNIEIVYDKIKKYDKYIYNSDKKNNIEIYNNIVFIINLDENNNTNIDNILTYLPKNTDIIINIKLENNKLEEYFDNYLIEKIDKLIITKSYNLTNYHILEFINNQILNKKNISSHNIIYINNYYDTFYDDILNMSSNNLNESIILFNNDIDKFIYCIDYNYLYDLLEIVIDVTDIIKIFIFYYIIKKNIYNLANNTFLISYEILNKIINNNFSKEILILF